MSLSTAISSETSVDGRDLDEFLLMGERDAFGHLGAARFPMELAADPKRANEMLEQYALACESHLDELHNNLARLHGSPVQTDEEARSIEHEYAYWWQMRRAFKLCRALWGAIDQSTAHYIESAGLSTRGTLLRTCTTIYSTL